MNEKKGRSKMLIPAVIMFLLAVVLFIIAYNRGQGEHIAGLRTAGNLMIQILPIFTCAMLVAGLVQVLLPREFLLKWVGVESGLRGIMIGSLAGGLTPGGPFVNLPIAAALLKSGAGVGTMVAYLTGWSLWAVARLPMEFGIMGWKFTLMRIASVIFLPPLAGLIAQFLFSGVKTY